MIPWRVLICTKQSKDAQRSYCVSLAGTLNTTTSALPGLQSSKYEILQTVSHHFKLVPSSIFPSIVCIFFLKLSTVFETLGWKSHAEFILGKPINSMCDLYFPFIYEVTSNHQSSQRSLSICPSSPFPNLPLPVLQMHPTTVPPAHPPYFHSQLHGMNAPDCHFWTLLIRGAESRVWATKCMSSLTVFSIPPWDVGSCSSASDMMEGLVASMQGGKEGRKKRLKEGRKEGSPQVDDKQMSPSHPINHTSRKPPPTTYDSHFSKPSNLSKCHLHYNTTTFICTPLLFS